MTINELRTKRIGILGWGVNHYAVTRWLIRHGVTQLTVLDEQRERSTVTKESIDRSLPIEWRLGPAAFERLTDFELLLRTPGIPLDHPQLAAARAAGVTISSQTQLFFELCPARTIGVTGTKGKGTTASLIFQMIDAEGKRQNLPRRQAGAKGKSFGKAYLAGNIGVDPFEFLDELTANDWVVLELSSFQLEDLTVSPHIAVVLSILEDHLDRHGTLEGYRAVKQSIVAHQQPTDHAILHADDPVSASFAHLTPAQIHWFSRTEPVADGASVVARDGADWFVVTNAGGEQQFVAPTTELQLRGPHNQENVAAALVAAKLAGASTDVSAATLRSFQPLPNRLETVGTVNAITYVNDSYATAPLPTIAALRSFDEPIVLMLGGRGKGADYAELVSAIRSSSVRLVIGYGEEGQRFQSLLNEADDRLQILYERGFDAAFLRATQSAHPGEVVLLSPSATSYDQFANYTERGNRFRELVHGIGRTKRQESSIKQGHNE